MRNNNNKITIIIEQVCCNRRRNIYEYIPVAQLCMENIKFARVPEQIRSDCLNGKIIRYITQLHASAPIQAPKMLYIVNSLHWN